MGLKFSCPKVHESGDLDSCLGLEDAKDSGLGSISFNGCEMRTCDLRKILSERSLSFKEGNSATNLSAVSCRADSGTEDVATPVKSKKSVTQDKLEDSSGFSQRNSQYEAALKLQKVYKSFRTRRRLADCAVLVEQRWWKLLDFAELKRSTISFFDIQKSETAVSRWSRARTKAAKVGNGQSKDEKARQLALQHWLEAIDPRHRYGHNLQFYYVAWLHCDGNQPFFYWLDIGKGTEVNIEKCSRTKLQKQCIKYLGPASSFTFSLSHCHPAECRHSVNGQKNKKY